MGMISFLIPAIKMRRTILLRIGEVVKLGKEYEYREMTKDYEEEGYYEEHTLLTQKQSEKSDVELRGDRAELEKMVADLREGEMLVNCQKK